MYAIRSYYDTLGLISNENLGGDRTLTLNLNDANRILTLQGDLTVESASLLNQDLTTDASPTFAGVTIDAVNITDITTDTTLATASNTQLATSLAIKTYVDGQIGGTNYWELNSGVVIV